LTSGKRRIKVPVQLALKEIGIRNIRSEGIAMYRLREEYDLIQYSRLYYNQAVYT
jgi:hypothetical protein